MKLSFLSHPQPPRHSFIPSPPPLFPRLSACPSFSHMLSLSIAPRSATHTAFSVSLSPHTPHTHTHTLSLSFSLSLSLFRSLPISFYLSLTAQPPPISPPRPPQPYPVSRLSFFPPLPLLYPAILPLITS